MLGALVSLLHLAVAPTAAGAGDQAFLGIGAPVQAPYGYLQFCVRRPDQCGGADPARGAALTLVRQALAAPQAGTNLDPRATAARPYYPPEADTARRDGVVGGPGTGALDVVVDQGRARTVLRLGDDAWRLLQSVNRRYNELIQPMSDEAAFGASNYWTLPIEDEHAAVGNCKHYALEKRKALVDAGVSPEVLSLALVRTRQGELHAVLVVATDRGDMVLDNLTPGVVSWRRLGYRWLVRQTPGAPLRWAAIPAA